MACATARYPQREFVRSAAVTTALPSRAPERRLPGPKRSRSHAAKGCNQSVSRVQPEKAKPILDASIPILPVMKISRTGVAPQPVVAPASGRTLFVNEARFGRHPKLCAPVQARAKINVFPIRNTAQVFVETNVPNSRSSETQDRKSV